MIHQKRNLHEALLTKESFFHIAQKLALVEIPWINMNDDVTRPHKTVV